MLGRVGCVSLVATSFLDMVRPCVVAVVRFGACQVYSGICWVFNWGHASKEKLRENHRFKTNPPQKKGQTLR